MLCLRNRIGRLWIGVFCLLAWTSQAQYRLKGTARASGEDCFVLTERLQGESGAVWYDQKLDLRTSFSLEFTMNLDQKPDGADGIMFVLQTVGPEALGLNGKGIGFAGFAPSLGVEFDTYYNDDNGDPPFDHLAVHRDGVTHHGVPTNIAGPTRIKPAKDMAKDGQDYRVRMVWDAPARRLKVLVDCEERLAITVDLVNDVFKGVPEVWWGFTSATGLHFSRQTVCLKKDIVEKKNYLVCRGEAVQLLARQSPDNQYVWSPATGLDNPGSRTPTARPTQSQWYTATTRDYCNTVNLDSFFVEVRPPLTVDLGPDRSICPDVPGVTFTARASQDGGPLRYRWSTGATTAVLPVSQPGRYAVEVADEVCRSRDTVQLIRLPPPNVGPAPDQPACLSNGPVELRVEAREPNLRFAWSPGGGSDAWQTVSRPETYRVQVTSPAGCTLTQTFPVLEYCTPVFFVPDAFTPNGDGQNDDLQIIGLGSTDLELLIYDRWGEVIFRTSDLAKRWDGRYQGIHCAAGEYAYAIRFRSLLDEKGPVAVKRGRITLIR